MRSYLRQNCYGISWLRASKSTSPRNRTRSTIYRPTHHASILLHRPPDEFNQRSTPPDIVSTTPFNAHRAQETYLVGRPVMPFSWYAPLPLASILPAMSICAHRTLGSSSPSAGSTPSTKDLRNSAAVQQPAREPPVCRKRTSVW